MTNQKLGLKEDDTAWMQQPANKGGGGSALQRQLEEIKEYVYSAFDKLDRNGNGFIETEELYAALEESSTPMREKSFITFLLMNQGDLSDMVKETSTDQSPGISRLDLDKYFNLAIKKLSQ